MTDYKNIVPKAQGGDPKALDELYGSTCRAVYFTCLSLLKNEQDAEDLMQNTYITAFKKLQTLEQPEKFELWIKRVAANRCKDFLYKKGTHPSEPLDEEGFDGVDENFLPDEYVINAEKRAIVMKIMREQLSDVLYQTVIMFYFDEMSVATIAGEMNCPEGTVKYRLNAARAKIKRGVLDYEKKNDDKLYAFGGLPFLTRLLAEEANSVDVPALDVMSVITQNSPYVPDSTAVDPNFTANTAARIGGKMLGTLKAKIIAAAAAVAVVGGGTTAAILIANSVGSNYTSDPESYASSKPHGNESNNGGSGIDYGKSRFWFARQTWDEPPRTTFEGGVLADKRDIHDVDLRKIDGISAPFYAYKVLDESKEYVSGTFEDVLNSQWIIEPGKHVGIDTQQHSSDVPAPLYDGLGVITVFNFDDEPRTTAYCLEHNWWNNHQNREYPPDETRALGLDHELRDTGPAPKEYEMLDAIKAKFGTPHYIRYGSIHEDDQGLDPKTQLFKEVEREFDPTYGGLVATYYDMIYDYGDILMIITVKEQIIGTNNKNDVYYVEFWPRECWEHRTDIEPFYGGENDSEQMYSPYEGAPVDSGSDNDTDKQQFWFAKQTWTEAPRTEFEGGILADNRKTFDLRDIDELSAPFFSSILYSDDKTTDKFSDVWYNPHEIAPYDYVEVETRAADVEDPHSPYDGIGFIDIINFDTEEALSVEDCLEKGWWKTYAGEKGFLYETVTLGLDDSLRDDGDMPYEDKLMDAVIAKFGTPDYVRYSGYSEAETDEERRRAIYDKMAEVNDPQYDDQYIMLSYDLIYELGNDVIMSVVVWEQRNPKGEFVLNLDYVEFWGSGCWENRFEFGDKEDNDREEISLFPLFNGNGSENQSDSPFWIARQTWTEAPRKTFEGGILRDNRKTLNLLDIDDLSAPFFTGLAPTDNWITDKFSDIWYNDVDISSIYFNEINTQYVGYGKEPLPYDGIGTIQIYNFDNIPHLVEDCLENGWWKTAVTDDRAYMYETVALGLDSSLSRNNENYVYEEELVNAVIKKFGTPHYIYYPWVYNGSKNPDRRAAMYEDMESILNPVSGNEIHFIQYQFVYELENDLVMTVYISENRNSDDRITLNVDYVEFWSGACWENRHTVANMDFEMDEIELFKVYEP